MVEDLFTDVVDTWFPSQKMFLLIVREMFALAYWLFILQNLEKQNEKRLSYSVCMSLTIFEIFNIHFSQNEYKFLKFRENPTVYIVLYWLIFLQFYYFVLISLKPIL
jgi:hypothetical protein